MANFNIIECCNATTPCGHSDLYPPGRSLRSSAARLRFRFSFMSSVISEVGLVARITLVRVTSSSKSVINIPEVRSVTSRCSKSMLVVPTKGAAERSCRGEIGRCGDHSLHPSRYHAKGGSSSPAHGSERAALWIQIIHISDGAGCFGRQTNFRAGGTIAAIARLGGDHRGASRACGIWIVLNRRKSGAGRAQSPQTSVCAPCLRVHQSRFQ